MSLENLVQTKLGQADRQLKEAVADADILITEITIALTGMNLGISVWCKDPFFEAEHNGKKYYYKLGYQKTWSRNWAIVVYCDRDIDWPRNLQECDPDVRVAAMRPAGIDKLLDTLAIEARDMTYRINKILGRN